MMLRKNVLGSQRGLQFGGPAILNKNAKNVILDSIVYKNNLFLLFFKILIFLHILTTYLIIFLTFFFFKMNIF